MIDLTQYEDAATLNRWFLNNYPLGRIDLQLVEINLDKGIVVFKGSLYRDSNDANPAVTNYAKGERDDYPAHMRKWYLEDTATSCIARCLTLLKGSNKTAPKESMARATSWSVEPKIALDDEFSLLSLFLICKSLYSLFSNFMKSTCFTNAAQHQIHPCLERMLSRYLSNNSPTIFSAAIEC